MENQLMAGAALFLGALHALEPGHGKTVVAAYMLGARGGLWPALTLGCSIALSHTLTIMLLALALRAAAETVTDARLHLFAESFSAALMLVIGALMLRRARRSNRSEHHHGAEAECCGRAGDERQPGRQMSGRQMSGRMTVLVGLSGGLIPCPGALAALLTAGASGRLLSGLWLVLLFSVGIAATLVSVGLLARRMGAAFNRRVSSRRWERRAAVLSGALVIGVGLVSLLRVLTHLD